jgi:UDP-3-O-[3-hydroxymyristoyl] N-acetylglucosamine deacetylase
LASLCSIGALAMTLVSTARSTTQKSVGSPCVFKGLGIHTGQDCTVTVQPAPVDHGLVFQSQGVQIPALADYVVRCDRSTMLGIGDQTISTVEHLLAALVGAGIANALIEVVGPEIPILDGSAQPFFDGLVAGGVVDQQTERERMILRRPIWVGEGNSGVLALPSNETIYQYALHYDHPMIGYQPVEFRPASQDFASELGSASTFALWEEVEPLLKRGLALGGSLDNALIAYQDRWSREFKVPNEPARHKCMDMLGDLALVGNEVVGQFIGVRAGHRWHVEMAKALRLEMSCS